MTSRINTALSTRCGHVVEEATVYRELGILQQLQCLLHAVHAPYHRDTGMYVSLVRGLWIASCLEILFSRVALAPHDISAAHAFRSNSYENELEI